MEFQPLLKYQLRKGLLIVFANRWRNDLKGSLNPNTSPPGISAYQQFTQPEIVVQPTDVVDNRTKRRQELERLKQDVNDGIVTDKEYEKLREDIFEKISDLIHTGLTQYQLNIKGGDYFASLVMTEIYFCV